MAHTKVGLIGAGLLGLTHGVSLAILRNAGLCDLELVSVFDPNGPAAESLAKNIGLRRVGGLGRGDHNGQTRSIPSLSPPRHASMRTT